MAWGKSLDEWSLIHPRYRAKMIAHYLLSSIRESYSWHKRQPKKKGEGNRYDQVMQEFR